MRINAINGNLYQTNKSNSCKKVNVNNNLKTDTVNSTNQVAFKSTMGKFAGGIFGALASGIGAIVLLANPLGIAAAAATIVAETGGAVIGGAIGDAITGKDDD